MTAFDDSPEVELNPIPRDHLQRPRIIGLDGKVRSYTRASTYAKSLSNADGLTQWKLRIAARGLYRQPTLFNDLRAVGPQAEHNLSVMDGVLTAAHEAGGGFDGSRWGTLLHSLTEWFDAEDYLMPRDSNIPVDVLDALDRYVELTKNVEMLACEGFVVLDDLQVGGTYDRICVLPDPMAGRVVVADVKTGPRIHQNVAEAAMQMSMYARGIHYAPDGTRERGLLEHVDTSLGVIIQISRDGSGDRLIPVDLDEGWRRVQLAGQVREKRTMKPIALGLVDVPPF